MVGRCRPHSEGPELSRLVWGAFRLLDGPRPAGASEIVRLVETCLDLGITTIDHADIYGGYRVEAAFGEALAARPDLRSRIELVTKCGIGLLAGERPDHRVKHYDSSAAHIRASVERSLRNLHAETIDVLLLHRPDPLLDADEAAGELEALVRDGLVRAVGVSNYTPTQLALLRDRLTTPLVTNQLEISLVRPGALEDGSLDEAQRLRMHPMAWGPLGGGRLFDDDTPLGRALRETAEAYALPGPAAAALAWVMRLPSAPLPVVGTTRAERLPDLAAAASVRLETQDWFALYEAARGRAVA